ncbi:hypothetical protein BJ138DRAFT_1085771 [Hygrophoropsis aurantiaca]|uniref:Uncharacterized protein n=1 Tax=Hygrophoropsis aurantiaca TaxID=72124 RepID=A0ACB8ACY9_9AGAM|nr:hypothetical protein BJ138DRAFT_1085771 [Hygrophoropsis aurantiaca]
MSSKRGRKRNDNLPPNRARDVQRAFRARRAAHLQALELRVTELEEENNCLRAALNLPPASRPTLGKGPTGKDKPKSLDHEPTSQSSKSRDSSLAAESPSPRRSESVSPGLITSNIRTSPMIESGNWEESFIMNDQQPRGSHVSSTSSNPYNLRPIPPVIPQKSPQQFTFSNQIPSASRSVMPSNVQGHPLQSSYSHSTDRPTGTGYNDMNYLLCDVADSSPQYQYQYHPSAFATEHSVSSHSQTPVHSQGHTPQRPPPGLPYHQRRSATDPQSFRTLGNDLHLASPPPHTHGMRLASPPDSVHEPRPHYTPHGKHINALP